MNSFNVKMIFLDLPFRKWKLLSEVVVALSRNEQSTFLTSPKIHKPGKPSWRERLCTVNLLVLTNLDHLLFILKTLFTFFREQASLMRRSTVLSLPNEEVNLTEPSLQISFPANHYWWKHAMNKNPHLNKLQRGWWVRK
jgi:hypothetical protein